MSTSDILLVSVNARYSHSSYAIRSLRANLGELATNTSFLETDLDITPIQLAEQIAQRKPRVVGFSIYLWNRLLVEATVRILRVAHPEMICVAGGPELVESNEASGVKLWDAIIFGEGESTFRKVCKALFSNDPLIPAPETLPYFHAVPEDLTQLGLPYDEYSDTDIAQRTIYAETSRGSLLLFLLHVGWILAEALSSGKIIAGV
jgi:radical SAM superfamily enzyme YgiQ (UPF0313 family)